MFRAFVLAVVFRLMLQKAEGILGYYRGRRSTSMIWDRRLPNRLQSYGPSGYNDYLDMDYSTYMRIRRQRRQPQLRTCDLSDLD